MSKKKLVIGLGTGRCGTVSLARFLNIQRNAYITHEERAAIIRWYDSFERVEIFVKDMLNQSHDIISDVSFFFLPYVEYIIKEVGTKAELYFICLQRDKTKTINSFRKKHKWIEKNRHPWYAGPGFDKNYIWDNCFPKFGFIDPEDAISYYWDMYYDISNRIQHKYPNKFKVFNIEILNTIQGQKEMLTFLRIAEKSMVLNKNLSKLNKSDN